jgi:hypothetical protein
MRRRAWAAVALVSVAAMGACGPYPYHTPVYTSSVPDLPAPQLVKVSIGADGVSPAHVDAPRATLQFSNADVEPHDIRSGPHPAHNGCAQLNIELIAPGETVSVLTPIEAGRTCTFHDERRLADGRFEGTITIR